MPNFSVPNNINPGDALDANKAMANWNQVVTDLNGSGATGGGKIDATNVAAAFANGNVEPAFSTYKAVHENAATVTNAVVTGAATYVLVGDNGAASTANANPSAMFPFDPADFTAGSRTSKLRLTAGYIAAVAQSGVTVTLGMYPVTAVSATSVTLGAVVTGSTTAFANPTVPSLLRQNSGDFTAPSAGLYVIGFTTGGAFAASAAAVISTALQVRQV